IPPPGFTSHKRLCGNNGTRNHTLLGGGRSKKKRGEHKVRPYIRYRDTGIPGGSGDELEPIEVAGGCAAAEGEVDVVDAGGFGDGDGGEGEDVPAAGAGEHHGSQELAFAQRAVDGDEDSAAGVGVVDADAGLERGCAASA